MVFDLERVRGGKNTLAYLAYKNPRFLLFSSSGKLQFPVPFPVRLLCQSIQEKNPNKWDPFLGAGEGSRTPVSCLESRHNNRYTTPANIKISQKLYGRPDASCFEHLLSWIDQIMQLYKTQDTR